MKRCSRSAAMNGCCFYPFYRGSSSLPLAVCAKGRASFSLLDCISYNLQFLVPKEVLTLQIRSTTMKATIECLSWLVDTV